MRFIWIVALDFEIEISPFWIDFDPHPLNCVTFRTVPSVLNLKCWWFRCSGCELGNRMNRYACSGNYKGKLPSVDVNCIIRSNFVHLQTILIFVIQFRVPLINNLLLLLIKGVSNCVYGCFRSSYKPSMISSYRSSRIYLIRLAFNSN